MGNTCVCCFKSQNDPHDELSKRMNTKLDGTKSITQQIQDHGEMGQKPDEISQPPPQGLMSAIQKINSQAQDIIEKDAASPAKPVGQIVEEPKVEPEEPFIEGPPAVDPVVLFKENLLKRCGKDKVEQIGIFMGDDDCLEVLQQILDAQLDTTNQMLSQDFFQMEFEISKGPNAEKADDAELKIQNNSRQNEAKKSMEGVNNLNWQYQILQNSEGKYIPINDYDSMIIGQYMRDIRQNPNAPKQMELAALNLKMNLYSSVIVNKQGRLKVLQKAQTNERFHRARPAQNEAAVEHSVCLQQNSFCADIGAYGQEWGRKYHNDNNAQPTFTEMMDGVFEWYHDQLKNELKGKSKQEQVMIMNTSKKIFNELIKNAGITQPNTKLSIHDPELGVKNPYSKITCFVLMLYSMEFGSPPLYVEVNRIMREWDLRYLKTLGPISSVIGFIAGSGEKWRDDDDKITMGETIKKHQGGARQNMYGCFLLYRGAQMKQEWLGPYEENNVFKGQVIPDGKWKGHKWFVRLPGNTSCTQDLSVAFKFAFQDYNGEKIPTIFIFSCKNYGMPPGIRLNSEAYTAYPSEGETLLTEGTRIYVMMVQKDFVIENRHASFKGYNGQAITIVHSFIG